MKIRMTIEIDLGNTFIDYKDDEGRMWAENEILIGNRELIVHSNEIGDYIGEVTKVSDLTWLDADSEIKQMDDDYPLIAMKDIDKEARLIAVRWHENATNWIGDKHKLASDIMNYARRKRANDR